MAHIAKDDQNQIRSSRIELSAEIDLDLIKQEISERGPIVASKKNFPIEIVVDIKACQCGNPDCHGDVVIVQRICGLSKVFWMFDDSDLTQYPTLNDLIEWVFHFGLDNSLAERVMMEDEIKEHIGVPYFEVQDPLCACSACAAEAGPEYLWRQIMLRNMAFNLQEREELLQWAEGLKGATADGVIRMEDQTQISISTLISESFDLGYVTGRLFSEHRLKEHLEASAISGMKLEADKKRRAKAAGKASTRNKQRRMTSILHGMQRLIERSPDLKRLPPKTVAELALNEVVDEDPQLWRQGQGRVTEYLEDMMVDHRFRGILEVLFNSKPL